MCFFDVHSLFLIIACLILSQALMFEIFPDCWQMCFLGYANYSFHVSIIHLLKFHYMEESSSTLGSYLHHLSIFTLIHMLSILTSCQHIRKRKRQLYIHWHHTRPPNNVKYWYLILIFVTWFVTTGLSGLWLVSDYKSLRTVHD